MEFTRNMASKMCGCDLKGLPVDQDIACSHGRRDRCLTPWLQRHVRGNARPQDTRGSAQHSRQVPEPLAELLTCF